MTPALTILGPPSQKKNSPQVGYVGKLCPLCKRGQPRVFPDAKFRIWERSALRQLARQWQGDPLGSKKHPLVVSATFYLGKGQRSDLSNLLNAVGDVLQKAKVITSDYWIESWGRSRRHRDPSCPRVEIEIELFIPSSPRAVVATTALKPVTN